MLFACILSSRVHYEVLKNNEKSSDKFCNNYPLSTKTVTLTIQHFTKSVAWSKASPPRNDKNTHNVHTTTKNANNVPKTTEKTYIVRTTTKNTYNVSTASKHTDNYVLKTTTNIDNAPTTTKLVFMKEAPSTKWSSRSVTAGLSSNITATVSTTESRTWPACLA